MITTADAVASVAAETPAVGGSAFAPDGSSLPPGWVTKVSASSGGIYYRNDGDNLSSWEVPVSSDTTEAGVESLPQAIASQSAVDVRTKAAVHPSRAALIPSGPSKG